MRRVPDEARSAGLGRLLTPALAWLVAGLVVVLAILLAIGLTDPPPPRFDGAWLDAVIDLLVWVGAVGGLACGAAAAGHGLLLQAARDRAEAIAIDEVEQPIPSPSERLLGRAVGAALGLGGGAVLNLATVFLTKDQPPALFLLGLALMAYGVVCGLLMLTARRARRVGQTARERWRQRREAGLSRPLPHLHLGLLILLTLTAVGLQLTLVDWIVEDAAISFAYAKHAAAGEGFVTFPGGERVEGYSNPLWTFLLVGFYAVGIDGFVSNKIMAAVFATLTVPLTWAIAREARPHRADATALLAAALLAGSAQFAIWGAGGLENSLLNVGIAAAVWRALVEGRKGGWPWSAVLWLAVALTRPEGILYAALGGFWTMVYRAHRTFPDLRAAADNPSKLPGALWSAIWPTLAWLAMFFLPFGLYHAWRYDYFAWELPNTYYAKKANPGKAFEPFSWTRKGWKYVRDWAHFLWQGALLPVYLVGVLGTKGVRSLIAVFLMVLTLVVLTDATPIWINDAAGYIFVDPDWWVPLRVCALFAVGAVPAVLAIGRPGWRALSLCLSVAVGAIFFAVYAGGDWMGGFRWMSSFTVPGAVLLAVGISELAERARRIDTQTWIPGTIVAGALVLVLLVLCIGLWVPPSSGLFGFEKVGARVITPWLVLGVAVMVGASVAIGLGAQRNRNQALRWGPLAWTTLFLMLGMATVPSITRLDKFLSRPTTSPWSVKRRVDYMNKVQERLHIDERPTNMDVDMGATMYWSDDRIVDIAGLVDVSMGHHWFDRPFIVQYVFQEHRPHFAHVHGGWAKTSRLNTYEEWEDNYIEIPPYPVGRKDHPGNHVRKDLIVRPSAPGPTRAPVDFAEGLVLKGWDIPAETASPGRHLYLELAWSTLRERSSAEDVQVTVFLAHADGEVAHSWDAPPGFGYYKAKDWKVGEVVVGRYSLPIPDDVPLGTYDFGIVATSDPRGEPLPAVFVPPDAPADGEDGPAEDAPLTEDPVAPVVDPERAVFRRGEARWPSAIRLIATGETDAGITQDIGGALASAGQGDCGAAVESWRIARRRGTRTELLEPREPEVRRAIAACYARRGSVAAERTAQLDAFVQAHDWDHRTPELITGRVDLVTALIAEGQSAREAQQWPAAYAAFRDALRIDPSQAWARRWALEALDCTHEINLDRHPCGEGVVPPSALVAPIPSPEDAPVRVPKTTPPLPPSLRARDTDAAP